MSKTRTRLASRGKRTTLSLAASAMEVVRAQSLIAGAPFGAWVETCIEVAMLHHAELRAAIQSKIDAELAQRDGRTTNLDTTDSDG
jgi:hypothetical protein